MANDEPISGGQLMQWSDTDKADAEAVKQALLEQFEAVRVHERVLETTFVELAKSLKRVRERKFWALWGYHSWTSYVSSLHHMVRRSTLFQYIGVLEALSEQISDDELTQMGIRKAIELKRVLSAKPDALLSDGLKAKALDPSATVDDVRQAAFEAHNVKPDYPGAFFDMGGFYATAEDRALLKRAFDVARRVDPPISNSIPDWAQRKEILLRMAADFLSSWEAEVEGQQT